jgi:hypothetical protein
MKSPICPLCPAGTPRGRVLKLVRFSDYESKPEICGYCEGLSWFCDEHITLAKQHTHLPLKQALISINNFINSK